VSDQRDFFRSVERDYWASAEGLKDEELALIDRHLDPALPTLDAGTGGGRIPRALRLLGFEQVTGFDFAPELVAAARAADEEGTIAFDVADATDLPYDDGRFGQALYLQQMICTIDDAAGRMDALREAARVLAPGGVALFSFVCLEARMAAPAQRAYVSYLRALRRIRGSERPIRSMPRLRLKGRFDRGALRDAGPYNWWYRAEEAEQAVTTAGFEIAEVGFSAAVLAGELSANAAGALAGEAAGALYVVAKVSGR
jgi:SAM-dependent methyltransferase